LKGLINKCHYENVLIAAQNGIRLIHRFGIAQNATGNWTIATMWMKGGIRMQVIAKFAGKNRVFRAWLAAGMPENVVSLQEYRKKKKTASRAANSKPFKPSIA